MKVHLLLFTLLIFAVPGFGQSSIFRNPNISSTVITSIQQPDEKIIIGGIFNSVGLQQRRYLARLNPNGTLDASFPNLNIDDTVRALALQPDGKILIGGSFFNVAGQTSPRIARINPDGSLDSSFQQPGILTGGQSISTIALAGDGKILIGGLIGNINGQVKSGIARLNPNGTLDTSFQTSLTGPGFDPVVSTIIVRPDGKILFSGYFTSVNGQSRNGIAQLNNDGSVETGFTYQASGNVDKIALQSDGKIVIGNGFTGIARINSDGSLDSAFQNLNIPSSNVLTIALQPDSKILVGGLFTSINGQPRWRLARLNTDGSLDLSFVNPMITSGNAQVYSIGVRNDRKILVAGDFGNVGTKTRLNMARLNSDGSVESSLIAYDFNGDERSDFAVFRPTNGNWYFRNTSNSFATVSFGLNGDKMAPADYDGDGRIDIAVVRNGIWYLQRSQAGFTGIQFGNGDDIPVPGDYDGDGKSEIAVFRPSNGYWYILNLVNNQFSAILFGLNGDKPVPADYDGDGKTDIAVNRNGIWYLNRSQAGFTGISFGDSNDRLVPADYDGDGKTDIAVFRPANGTWYLQQSSAGLVGVAFGFGTDLPVPADYDGDGVADIGVVREGYWYVQRSTQGYTGFSFGLSTDLPISNVYVR